MSYCIRNPQKLAVRSFAANFLFFVCVLLIQNTYCESALCEERKPNVIIIYADDLGTIDANCYGSKDLFTPNIDSLAENGIRFTQMYAPSAICSASRAGLMTGKIPARAGVPGNVSSMKGKSGMPTTEVTFAELMKGAGYKGGACWQMAFGLHTRNDAKWARLFGKLRAYGWMHRQLLSLFLLGRSEPTRLVAKRERNFS